MRNLAARRVRDVTQGSLARNIWQLAWPITIAQALLQFPALYDAIWLGRLGREAQAAAGLAMSVRMTMISVLMALSVGSGAVVARYVGARDQEQADLGAMQAVILMVVSAGVLGLLGIIFVRPFLTWAGADETTLPMAISYARVLFAGLIAIELVPSMGFMLNAAGEPNVLLAMTLSTTVVLVISEPLLTRWWGVPGAAWALVGSHVVGMAWGLTVLISGRGPVHLDLRRLRIDLPMMGRIVRLSLPAVLQRGTPNVATSLLTRLASAYGAPTLAAWIVVQRVFNLATVPGWGLSRVAPAMVGQNLGAAQPARARQAVRLLLQVTTVISIGVLGLLALLAPQVLTLFSKDPETITIGTQAVRFLSLGYLAFSLSLVFDAAQAGAGDTVSPMVINLLALWVLQVPLAFLLTRATHLGATGIWLGLVVGWAVQLALMGLRFRQGHWQRIRI